MQDNSANRIPLYQCESLIEAHLLKGMLEQCNIDVALHGESLLGAVGELPASGLLVLWVDKSSAERARVLLTQYEEHDLESGTDKNRGGHFLA